MKKVMLILLVVIAIVLSVALFNPLPFNTFGYFCVSEKPKESQFVGVWVADETTLEDMRVRGKYDKTVVPKIILKENGKVEVKDLPNWWRSDFGKSNGLFESYIGEWKLDNFKGSCYSLWLNFRSVGTTFGVLEYKFDSEKQYIITIGLGDPDSNETMVFVKEK